eukprot:2153907-Ditylum_brightwellii.AAC.1
MSIQDASSNVCPLTSNFTRTPVATYPLLPLRHHMQFEGIDDNRNIDWIQTTIAKWLITYVGVISTFDTTYVQYIDVDGKNVLNNFGCITDYTIGLPSVYMEEKKMHTAKEVFHKHQQAITIENDQHRNILWAPASYDIGNN